MQPPESTHPRQAGSKPNTHPAHSHARKRLLPYPEGYAWATIQQSNHTKWVKIVQLRGWVFVEGPVLRETIPKPGKMQEQGYVDMLYAQYHHSRERGLPKMSPCYSSIKWSESIFFSSNTPIVETPTPFNESSFFQIGSRPSNTIIKDFLLPSGSISFRSSAVKPNSTASPSTASRKECSWPSA